MEKINFKIMQHLDFLESVIRVSGEINALAENGNIQKIEKEIENRDRLINLVNHKQLQIEEDMEKLIGKRIPTSQLSIFRSWVSDINLIMSDLVNLDQAIVQHLEIARGKTSDEITHLFKSRQQFKGYNLNSVKR